MSKYLDTAGLSHLVSLIKNAFVAKEDGKGLSDENYSSTEKSKLSGIASGAQANVIESVKVNNSALTVSDKAVSIPNASTSAYGATKLTSATDSTSEELAATAKAVKTAYDLAASKTSNNGTVTQVKVGDTTYDQTDGVVSLPAYPTTLPASDVSAWAKASSKPSYTKSEVGLGNVTNDAQVKRSEMGVANGVATLGSDGKVPSSQLPSFVDDVLEGYLYSGKFYKESSHTTQIEAESDKIYVDIATNKTYRYGGSATGYVEISASLALGTTSSTAFAGDKGQAAYDHAVTNKGAAFTSGLYKITTNSEGHVTAATAVEKSDITALGIPGSDTDTKVTSAANHYAPAKDTNSTKNASGATGTSGNTVQVVTGIEMDAKGHVTGIISGAATDTTYEEATVNAAGLMSAYDKDKLNGIATGATAVTESTVAGWGFTKNVGTLTSHQTIKQNAVTGATANTWVSCSTAAATAAKTGTLAAGTPALEAGLHVFVKFANANTASNPTLNINNKGAKNIYFDGTLISTGEEKSLLSGVCELVYDGTQFHLLGKSMPMSTEDIDTIWNG